MRSYDLNDNYFLIIYFIGSIASKEEKNRAVAVQAIKNLAQQCSDPGAVEKTVGSLFKVLGGEI